MDQNTKPKSRSKTAKQAVKRPKSRPKTYSKGSYSKNKQGSKKFSPKPKRGGSVKSKSSRKSVVSKKSTTGKVAAQSSRQASGPTTSIFIMGSPNDQTVEMLQALVQQMNMQQQPEEYVTDQKQLEELFDAFIELRNNTRTIQDSYEEIIRSLVNLQRRRTSRAKTLMPLDGKAPALAEQTTFEPPQQDDPGNIDRFMDSATRDKAFGQLFARVDMLKSAMATFTDCFDGKWNFIASKYEKHPITPGQRDSWLAEIGFLSATVEKLLAEYNKEVLNLFRISSQLESNSDSN